jgi:Tfp pilus assembly protein PilF
MEVDSSQPSTAYIRQFLVEAFSDDEFSDLCFDYFRDVSETFSSGMTKRQKVQLLIEHCERRNAIANLLAAIQRIRPEQYKEHSPRVPQVRPEPLRLERDPRRQEIMVGPYEAPSLPPIWNIPHHRNPNFTGRADLLEAIEKALASGQRAALTQVIAGLGGVGKTQLAVEYAYRHAAQYQAVWWLRAEQPATLAADYARLAAPLNLAEKDAADQRDVVRAVQSWLGRNPGWLLIFDNAPDAASIREVLPQGECGHVLVTSRDPNWLGTAPVVSVQVMARAESVEFLCKRTGLAEEPAAHKLAEELGDLPLALEQAGAYIEATSQSFAGYLDLFRVHHQELLERGKPTTDYPDTVATTWLISFEAAKATPGAADVLSLLAHFAPDDIPLEMVKISEALKDLGDLEWQDALAALRRYSLIEVRGETVSVHRLVQAVARDQLSDDARKRWAEAAVQIVGDAFPHDSDDVRTWPTCARLLPHALATAGHAEAMQVAPQATGHLLNQVGLYLGGRAELRQAKAALERALRMGEAAYGPDHPNVATRVNNLGSVLQDMGNLAGARAHYERALRIDEAAYGPDHPEVAIRLNNLGEVLRNMGDLAGARAQLERALRIDEVAFGPDHPNVATDVNNLGLVLKAMGDLAGARAQYERALRIDEAAYGPDHPQVAIFVSNLGSVLQAMGDLAGARACFERALRIRRQFLGEEHPKTVKVRNNLKNLPEG